VDEDARQTGHLGLASEYTRPGQVYFPDTAGYADFVQTLLQEDGLDYKLLEPYGLENMLIGAGLAKQDFHAKLYAGLSSNSVEVLSGSANLVRGASVENMAFRTLSRHSFQQRYLAKLNISLPTPPAESNLFALLYLADEGWRATDHSGSPLDS
jgi:hypothetical protein